MNKVTFYTNINCDTCKATVEKAFEGKNIYTDFQVDYSDPRRPATFTLNDGITTDQVQKLIQEAGYKAEMVDDTNMVRKLFSKK